MKHSYTKILAFLLLAGMLLLAGCTDEVNEDGPDGSDLSEDVGEELDAEVGESYWFEVTMTEENQANLVQERPPFRMDDSLERQNLIERYQYLNDRNNVHHVYMLSHDGKVVNYEVAQGKVSSVNSKLTNDKQVVKAQDCHFDEGNGAGGSNGACHKVVESPQMDGSYGTNGNAIFFFTTDGHYVEYNGLYVVSEEPKGITTEVQLTNDVGQDSSGVVQENASSNESVSEDFGEVSEENQIDEPDLNGSNETNESNNSSE